MSIQIAVRLPDELVSRLDRAGSASKRTRAEVVRTALDAYLYRIECEHDAAIYERTPLTDDELVVSDSAEVRPW